MHVLLEDNQGRLTLYRLRPWHQLAARFLADRLDQELARGARPEADPSLAARAIRLTSTNFRRDLAVSLQRLLAARPRPGAESGPLYRWACHDDLRAIVEQATRALD
jgi:hypothetical protein